MTENTVRPLKSQRLSLAAQARQYLLDLIKQGTYAPGSQLPSENELAAQFGISRPTLREALLNLEQEGFVVRKHGVGTFVASGCEHLLESGLECLESVLELAARQKLPVQVDNLEVKEVTAHTELSEKLQIPPGTLLTSVHRVIAVSGTPVAYMSDAVLSSILSPSDVDVAFNGSVLDLLRRKRNLQGAQAVADIVAINAAPSLAQKLEIKPHEALLLLEETLFNSDGTAVGFSRNYFVPDFFRFHIVRR